MFYNIVSEFKCNERFCFRIFGNLRPNKNHMNQNESFFNTNTDSDIKVILLI